MAYAACSCSRAPGRDFGRGRADHGRIAPPGPRARPLFSADDYPPAALRNEEAGTVRFRVAIGPNGRVGECTITGSSGSAALDGATCRILRSRLRYAPARPGAPVAGADLGWVSYRLPADRPRPSNLVTYQ